MLKLINVSSLGIILFEAYCTNKKWKRRLCTALRAIAVSYVLVELLGKLGIRKVECP